MTPFDRAAALVNQAGYPPGVPGEADDGHDDRLCDTASALLQAFRESATQSSNWGVDDECIATRDGKHATFALPRITVRVPYSPYPDQMARWALDDLHVFVAGM